MKKVKIIFAVFLAVIITLLPGKLSKKIMEFVYRRSGYGSEENCRKHLIEKRLIENFRRTYDEK